ncbi:MAG: acyltransferase [Actinomycetia bacterium]|nr:acyltransferase [Actinomycetes bacterium]
MAGWCPAQHRPPSTPGAAALASSTLDRLVADTPSSRDRVVDFARGFAICVVVLWHWTLSVTHRTGDDSLTMANPIHVVPGGWLMTWVLQVMPVFFLAGGYANLTGWVGARERGERAGTFISTRLRRLLIPTAVWAAIWLSAEVVTLLVRDEHRWMWQWFPGYLIPLWFIGVYAVLILLVPITARLHERGGLGVLAGLVVLVVVGSVLDRGLDWSWAGWVNAGFVWILIHQLGYAWRTWDLGHRPLMQRVAIAVVGLGTLVVLTGSGAYASSMVATVEGDSNILPTNATIVALAVFQLGLLVSLTPWLERVLQRPGVWKPVVAVNAVAMTIFSWHMSALLVTIWMYEGLGHQLMDEPTASWWAQRWLWLLAPLVVLAALIAAFGRIEFAARRSRR